MLDLIQKNLEMLQNKSYKLNDERSMLRISTLDNPNAYDLYLIACCLSNYNIPEKKEAQSLRLKYFLETNNGSINGFEHAITDYKHTSTNVKCTNTGNVNKYGLYEYEISINDKNLVSDLWEAKNRDCLKYVDSKTYNDKLIVSISRDQLANFISLLDKFMIQYDRNDIESGLFFKNKSTNELIDISKLQLPFTPYDFQIENAKQIIQKKRILIGHDMGCITGDAIITVKINNNIDKITLHELYNQFIDNIEVKTYVHNNMFEFMPIKAILDKGIQSIIKITTSNTSIKCTKDHEILTKTGWIEANKLKIGNTIISDNNKTEFITNIEYLSNEQVYDIVIDDIIISNFIANDLVVHNCGKTFISVLVGTSIGKDTTVKYDTLDNLNYNDIIITDKGPLPIGKIVEENIDCKVQVTKNGETKFVNITNRMCVNV